MFLFIDEIVGRTLWWAWGLPYGLQILVLVFIAAWVALLLHELAHGLRDEDAQQLGYRNVGREDWSFEWRHGSWRAPLISAAGGLANFFAAAAVVAYWTWMPRLSPPSFALFAMCLVVNLTMVLNLMPIRGLDGGRLVVHTAALRRALAAGT